MFNSHRTAFELKNSYTAIEHNLDKVVYETQVKLKEFQSTYQEKVKQNHLMKGQKNVIENDIKFYQKEITEKNEQIAFLSQEYDKVCEEIGQLEEEFRSGLTDYNAKNEDYFTTMYNVNENVEALVVINGIEETNKKSQYRLEYEAYSDIKDQKKLLTEIMFDLRKELYHLEVNILYLILECLQESV
jgi:hypothetical protein